MKWVTVLAPAALLLAAPILTLPGGSGTAEAQTVHVATGCNNCHKLHGSPGPQLLQDPVLEDLCLSCHNDASPYPGAPPGPFAVHDGPKHSSPTSCAECHGHPADAGTNLSLIRDEIPADTGGAAFVKLPVVFTSRGTDAGQSSLHSFADGDEDTDGDYDGVCEVCHTNTDNHRNGFDLPGNPDNSDHSHNRGRTCPDCHSHESGFAGGGPCSACHDTGGAGTQGPNSRRAIIPEFSRASHHIVWADSVPSSDCQACHDQSEHQQGTVRLWNVDSPGDTSKTIKLTGDPFTVPAEADKLELFCLACHDPAGAGPSQPFSDLNTPPTVDSTNWMASSHFAVGGFTCFDCHQSGHGSEKRKLLQPGDVAPTPPANAEEEEGFCFQCHDSDGPSTKNIQSQFDPSTIRQVTEAWGLGSHTDFNDRHDVQHEASSISGAKIECYDCHDPHAANATQPFKSDPDPGDGHVPAADSRWTGQSLLSDFCLDCHDNSFPPGVSTHSDAALTNILNTWLTIDRMGVVNSGGNEQLRTQGVAWDPAAGDTTSTGLVFYAQGDILDCDVCHRPHPKRSDQYATAHGDTLRYDFFGMVDTVMTKNGWPLSWSEFSAQGDPTSYTFDYGLTIDARASADPWDAGGYFCNSCHDRDGMNGRDTCGSSNCHAHGNSSPGL